MTIKRSIALIKEARLDSEEAFWSHLEIAVRSCASNKSLNVYRREFPNEVMEVERTLHQHSTI